MRDANFPTNNNNEITASDLRDWLTDGIDSFLTQKDKNVMEEVIWEAKSNNLTAGATTDLSLANGNFVHITGTTTTINSFGICDAGARFILVFEGVYTLDYDATQLILPGTANITTANNDCCMIVSEGSGNWRVVGYFPIAGGGGGGGGIPGGADTEVQYNNAGAFGGIPELTYSGGFVQIETPKIGTGSGNGHMHIHSANSAPTGITDYLTMFWQKATRALGFRSETDTHETYIQLTAPTADRTITIPDASGNVVIDTTVPSFSNGASAGEIRLREGSGGGTNYTAVKAAATLASDYSLTLPTTQGGSGQVIVNDGTGQLSWASNGGSTVSKFLGTVVPATVTGTTAETLLSELLIPANTFTAGDCFTIIFRARRQSVLATDRWNFYISNQSGVFSGKPLMGYITIGNIGQFGITCERNVTIYNATTTYYVNSTAARYDDFNNDNLSSSNIDWTVAQYIIMTCIPATTGQQIFNVSTHASPR